MHPCLFLFINQYLNSPAKQVVYLESYKLRLGQRKADCRCSIKRIGIVLRKSKPIWNLKLLIVNAHLAFTTAIGAHVASQFTQPPIAIKQVVEYIGMTSIDAGRVIRVAAVGGHQVIIAVISIAEFGIGIDIPLPLPAGINITVADYQ